MYYLDSPALIHTSRVTYWKACASHIGWKLSEPKSLSKIAVILFSRVLLLMKYIKTGIPTYPCLPLPFMIAQMECILFVETRGLPVQQEKYVVGNRAAQSFSIFWKKSQSMLPLENSPYGDRLFFEKQQNSLLFDLSHPMNYNPINNPKKIPPTRK